MQGASRQHRDRELRLRARAVMPVATPVAARCRAAHCGALGADRWLLVAAWRWPRRRRTPRPSRTPIPLQRGAALPVAGTRRARARSMPSARPSSTPRRARRRAPPAALVLEVGAETVPDDAGSGAADLAQRYGEAQFKEELPEADVRRGRPARGQDRQRQAGSRRRASRVHGRRRPAPRSSSWGSASVAPRCSSLITPGLRYRLMARALKEDFEQAQGGRRRVLRELPHPALGEAS